MDAIIIKLQRQRLTGVDGKPYLRATLSRLALNEAQFNGAPRFQNMPTPKQAARTSHNATSAQPTTTRIYVKVLMALVA